MGDKIKPSYCRKGGLECINVIKAITEGLHGSDVYWLGCVVKYIWRWRDKNGVEDLKKAAECLDQLIKGVEKEGAESEPAEPSKPAVATKPSISGWTVVYVECQKPVLLFDRQPNLSELAKAMKDAYKLPTVPSYDRWPGECFLTEFAFYEPNVVIPLRFACMPYTLAEAKHVFKMGYDLCNMSNREPKLTELAKACWLTNRGQH